MRLPHASAKGKARRRSGHFRKADDAFTDSQKEEMKMSTLAKTMRDDYLRLVNAFPLTSIKNDRELKAAQAVMDDILKTPRLKKGVVAYLEALSDLVMAYENTHHAIPPASDANMLRHLMEAKRISQTDLHKSTGIAMSTISEVLSGRRRFSKEMIGKLAVYFRVNKGVLAANL
jgi:HTH-type transcriptional regulator/antitoxin HigA